MQEQGKTVTRTGPSAAWPTRQEHRLSPLQGGSHNAESTAARVGGLSEEAAAGLLSGARADASTHLDSAAESPGG